ncbi:Crp/Fnr family transcriptional regulator [Mucilaginibacter sp. UR6-1]|uniref:Crp/Fnr family transcriptional regulator n=1 Tax=Mucilaginibacter sp. UR6-1 TaxID=1435643 RepID=UPI001E384A97|nr:Crp/Fnr family transcriptional regulator [Mucilaginibacter sp. UR6-1]MCC8410686.1 Crp/Fnr family transcriptional regulator [Mucilaginibacter sp. UR6-1]
MFATLIKHISKYVTLTPDEQEILTTYFKYEELSKKQYLLSEGEKCTAQYFVVQGCLRMYFIKENGSEHIVQFGIDNWWLSDYMSIEMQSPSKFYIQAVERTQVLKLSITDQQRLLERIPKLEHYFMRVMQKAFGAFQMRICYLFDMSGEEQYNLFVDRFPGFVQRVPQYMLASYLGVTPEFLSKIRGKKR